MECTGFTGVPVATGLRSQVSGPRCQRDPTFPGWEHRMTEWAPTVSHFLSRLQLEWHLIRVHAGFQSGYQQ